MVEAIDLNNEKWYKELENDLRFTGLDWPSANSGLRERMKKKINELPETTLLPSRNTYKYNKEEELDKLFYVSSEATSELNSKCFLINKVLNEFRHNKMNLSAYAIDRTLRKFCFSDFEKVKQHRSEVYAFLMECLESRPPLYAHLRWFWLCVITSQHFDANDDIKLRENVTVFIKQAKKFLTGDYRPLEYKLLLLTILEYDYAALVERQKNTKLYEEQPKATSASKRIFPLIELNHLDNIPLAYLLLCNVNNPNRSINESGEHEVEKFIVEDVLLKFNPRPKDEDGQPIKESQLYARLASLLLDVHQYVENGSNPYNKLSSPQLTQLPNKVQTLVRRFLKQFDDCESKEWRLFAEMATAPWIIEIAGIPGFWKTVKTPSRKQKKKVSIES